MIIYKTAGDDDDDGENSGAGEDGEGMAAGDVHGLMGGGGRRRNIHWTLVDEFRI